MSKVPGSHDKSISFCPGGFGVGLVDCYCAFVNHCTYISHLSEASSVVIPTFSIWSIIAGGRGVQVRFASHVVKRYDV